MTTPYLHLVCGTEDVDLLEGTLQLRAGVWSTKGPSPEGEWKASPFGPQFTFKEYNQVTETFELVGRGTAAELRAALAQIDRILELARRWHGDNFAGRPVYLKAQTDDAAVVRQAFIYGGSVQVTAQSVTSPLLSNNAVFVQLMLIRHPLWESFLYESQYAGTNLSCLGGKVNLWPDTYIGSAPGRINLELQGSSFDRLYTFWCGIRKPGAGYANFLSLWECESGTAGTDTALSKNAGEGASPSDTPASNKARVTYVTTSLAKRLSIQVRNVIATNQDHMAGRYVVLCRCKVSAGTSGIQLRYGPGTRHDNRFVQCDEVFIDNTAWFLVPLGEVSIPATGITYTDMPLAQHCAYTELQIWAEQVDGSGTTLDLDCLVFIPAEHFVSGTEADMTAVAKATIVSTEDERQLAYSGDITQEQFALSEFTARNFYLPITGGILVIAAERYEGSFLADEINAAFEVYPRWLSYDA